MEETDKAKRNEKIKADYESGMSFRDIAKKYKLSHGHIKDICTCHGYGGELKGLTRRVRLALNRAGIMTKDQLITELNEGLYARHIGEKSVVQIEVFTGKKLERDNRGRLRISMKGTT